MALRKKEKQGLGDSEMGLSVLMPIKNCYFY